MKTPRAAVRTRATAVSAVLVGLSLSLTACSGGGVLDGTYYAEDVNGTSNLGQLVVDGDDVTHNEYKCDAVYTKADVESTGQFSDDHSQISWITIGDDQRNERTGTETLSMTDDTITLGDTTYVRVDSDAGKAMLDKHRAEECD
ncbi:hypothetical protein NE857_22475 [Nocardiopsis exhalans]|uniref:Lipoprotein n=2 Tax=Nocardiopsis TaxID=2013 RepID=A0A840W653_9ACTN|nr:MULTISPECIES: hypothetical protein [Nocardiopsis]MBB5491532.1 hypothetical protein [Nocardiopsis metallicus]USY18081.1 hypothetical protein NE857_22475 [Nocardiopsis exhalans]